MRTHMVAGGRKAPLDDGLARSGYAYEQFAALAGPLTEPPVDAPYRVEYRTLDQSRWEWVTTRIIAYVLVTLDVAFMYWLIFRSQYPDLDRWAWHGGGH